MGSVYRARDLHFPNVVKLVAVKEMINLAPDPIIRQTIVQNFEREANMLATLNHPAIPRIYDYFSHNDHSYLVLEFVHGKDLETVISDANGFLPEDQVISWAIQLCDVLEYLHGHKPDPIIFRDMKPSNVMIVRGVQGELSKLLDFGVAALPRAPGEAPSAGAEMLVGTPEYMSPEQLRGDAIDARSDLYALGITMFECLQGEVPMPGGLDVAHQRASVPSLPPVSMVCDDVPKALADIVDRLLHPVAAFRFPSARSLLDALDASGLCRTPTRFLDDAPPETVAGRPTASGRRPEPEAEPVGAARRRSVRAYYQTPLRVMAASGAVIDGRSEDISSGGMLVIAGAPLPEGERVVVRFALPASGNMVQCSAVVNWSRHRAATQRGRAAFGLAFVDAPPGMTEAIARYAELMQREG